jgi:hypothetical protein
MQQFLTQAKAAVASNMPDDAVVSILGQQLKKMELVARIDELLKPYQAVVDARTTLSELVATRDADDPATQAFADAYAAGIKGAFGSSPTIDARFGVPRTGGKRGLSLEEKLAAKAKALETRKLRNTMGSRQKEGVKAKGEFSVSVSSGDSASSPAPASGSAPTASATIGGTPVVAAAPVSATPEPVSPPPAPPAPSPSVGQLNGATAAAQLNGAGH